MIRFMFLFMFLCLCAPWVAAQTPPAMNGEFKVPVSESALQSKRVIGAANFEKMRNLSDERLLFHTSRKIGALVIDGAPFCTGSLVGPDLLLTNHHCVNFERSDPDVLINPRKINVHMEYLGAGQLGEAHAVGEKIIAYSDSLDFALIRLSQAIGRHFGWLDVARTVPESGSVMVIQHPNGREKEVARTDADIFGQQGIVLHYYADTEPGSSGSPVFVLNGRKLIALHHAGACRKEHQDQRGRCLTFDFNEGIQISAIAAEIEQYLPGCEDDGEFVSEYPAKCHVPE